MPHVTRRIVFAAVLVVASGGGAVRGQDPDGGTGRGRPLSAYRPSVPGIHGLVTAGHPLAAMAGLQILMKGGNAIDAAVAVGAALNMMEPQMNGIGGNGFMTVYDKKSGHVYSLAMAGATPKAMKAEAMTPETLDWGITAGIVPGNLGGYVTALQRFGTMSLAEVFASGIDYAEHGYPIDPSLAAAIARAKGNLEKYPTTAKVFLPNGRAPEAGELFRNPDLAATLRKVVDAEQAALKQKKTPGAGARRGVRSLLQRRHRAGVRSVLQGEPRRHDGGGPCRLSPAVAGAGACDVPRLRRLQQPGDVARRHRARDAAQLGRRVRSREDGRKQSRSAARPHRSHQSREGGRVPLRRGPEVHTDPDGRAAVEKLRRLASQIDRAAQGDGLPVGRRTRTVWRRRHERRCGRCRARPRGPRFDENYETERDTTSFSIIDQYGNAVSCTPTLGGGFGAGVVVGNTGLLLNNGDRLGSSSPYPDNVNYVRGGQIPLLNNSPTIVLKDGRVAMVFGTPGGETIGQTEFQMLVNVIDFHMPVQQAVEHPRFVLDAKPNFYKPGSEISVTIERRVPPAALKALEEWGHKLAPTSDFTAAAGGMQAIVVDLAKGTMLAGADPRRTGYAVGW